MRKIEKTLELNITHEILSLADSFWWFVQPISLKKYWRPNWRFPLTQKPRSFATGLHINLEGKKGGGYDVCINSPSNFQGGNPRLLFMQFKAGVEQKYNSNPQSIFFGDSQKPNIHVEFDINSNAKKDQHRLLQTLATNAGNGNAVVYVFPRIVDEQQLQDSIGALLTKTSFISISDIDNKALVHGVKIDDGNAHKFRTCYKDFYKNEVNFFFFFFGRPEFPGGLLGEIFAIRMFRALHALKQSLLPAYPISKYHIMDAMIRHILNIASYFSVPTAFLSDRFRPYVEFSRRFSFINDLRDVPPPYEATEGQNIFLNEIFGDIFRALSAYIQWLEEIVRFDDSIIPNPPSNFTAEIDSGGLRFSIDGNFAAEDLDDITYSLI